MSRREAILAMGALGGSNYEKLADSVDCTHDCSPHPSSEIHLTGTSIMAVAFDGGVVMGADGRTTTGSYVSNRVTDKLDQVSDRIFVLRSGSAADTQAVGDIVKYYLNMHTSELDRQPSVHTAACMLRDLIFQNKDRLVAGMICGGWDPLEGGSVFDVCAYAGSLVKCPWAIGGSGSSYIYGLVDAKYRPGMGRQDCENLVASCLAHAMARDGSSGGPIHLVTIDKAGCERKYIPGDKLPFELKA